MMGEVNESDWKLFRKKLPEWQEAYAGDQDVFPDVFQYGTMPGEYEMLEWLGTSYENEIPKYMNKLLAA